MAKLTDQYPYTPQIQPPDLLEIRRQPSPARLSSTPRTSLSRDQMNAEERRRDRQERREKEDTLVVRELHEHGAQDAAEHFEPVNFSLFLLRGGANVPPPSAPTPPKSPIATFCSRGSGNKRTMSERAEGMLSAAPDTVDSPCQHEGRYARRACMHGDSQIPQKARSTIRPTLL